MILAIVVGLLIAKAAAQLWLERLNRAEVLRHGAEVPEAFRGAIDRATFRKAAAYTLAKIRYTRFEIVFDAIVLLLVLASGVLPASFRWFTGHFGGGAGAQAGYVLGIAMLMAIPSLPIQWREQFRLEAMFGFNTMTGKTWWLDRLKGLALSLALGWPLLALVVKLVEWAGAAWWIWAWAIVLAFQLLMVVLAPVLILPLFNKFTPLPEGALRERLLRLGARTGFNSRSIEVMDGSKRSRHSNAFFTGFGRFRKIVLFDTLISQLEEAELEAVLAHEIGHYKKGHVPKLLAGSAGGLLLAMFIVAWLARQAWFYQGFGFDPAAGLGPALLLFMLLSGMVTFWFSPLFNVLSRRFEFQADAYAAQAMGGARPLRDALRKLNEKNLSNLTPHPAYSGFYYSHPTLLEREKALAGVPVREGASPQAG